MTFEGLLGSQEVLLVLHVRYCRGSSRMTCDTRELGRERAEDDVMLFVFVCFVVLLAKDCHVGFPARNPAAV